MERPVFNHRYNRVLDDHTQRYNLYYVCVDLTSGRAFNIRGRALRRDLTPAAHQKYQSIQFVSKNTKSAMRNVVILYGWSDRNGPGTAYLWDGRGQ